jgi:hypothetical protein
MHLLPASLAHSRLMLCHEAPFLAAIRKMTGLPSLELTVGMGKTGHRHGAANHIERVLSGKVSAEVVALPPR